MANAPDSPVRLRQKRDLTNLSHFTKVVFMFETLLGLFSVVILSLLVSIAIKDFSERKNNNNE